MRASQLRQLLSEKCGEEQLEFRIPEIFLPPRFRDLSEGRDLLLMLDDDLTIHVRWHNEDFLEHHPLTPGESKRLVGEVLKYMTKYRELLKVFGKFIYEYAELPWDEERYHDGFRQEKEATQRAKKAGSEEEEESETAREEAESEEVIELHAVLEELRQVTAALEAEAGGESPMPDMGY